MDDTKSEKRKEVRTPIAGRMISASIRPQGKENEFLGFVVDRSADGFQVSTTNEIAPDTIVFLKLTYHSESVSGESQDFIAKIRWCKKNTLAEGFNVGVEILRSATTDQD
jgi:hypothetical protein